MKQISDSKFKSELHDVAVIGLQLVVSARHELSAVIELKSESGVRGVLRVDGVRANLVDGFGMQNIILSLDTVAADEPDFGNFCERFQYLESGGIETLKLQSRVQKLFGVEILSSVGLSCSFVAASISLKWD